MIRRHNDRVREAYLSRISRLSDGLSRRPASRIPHARQGRSARRRIPHARQGRMWIDESVRSARSHDGDGRRWRLGYPPIGARRARSHHGQARSWCMGNRLIGVGHGRPMPVPRRLLLLLWGGVLQRHPLA